jgi:hypothetical protein
MLVASKRPSTYIFSTIKLHGDPQRDRLAAPKHGASRSHILPSTTQRIAGHMLAATPTTHHL